MEHVSKSILPSKRERRNREEQRKGRRQTGRTISPRGLMAIHSDKSSDKGPENRIEKILPFTSKVFKDSLEEIEVVRRIRDAETLQRMSDEKDRAEQRSREFEEALVIALQAIRRLEQEEEERRKPILNEEEKIVFFPTVEAPAGVNRRN